MTKKSNPKPSKSFDRIVAWVITTCGSVGLFASFMLAIENIHHLKHPAQALACDLNPLIGCGTILDKWQGHVLFNIPNEFIGLIACTVLVTLGVMLLSGVKLPRWIWRGLQIGTVFGIGIVAWFMYESLFVLNHLCPYCMVTWTAIIPVAWYVFVYNLEIRNCLFTKHVEKLRSFAMQYHLEVIVGIFVLIIGSILYRFRNFFFK